MSSGGGTEYVFEHLFRQNGQAEVYVGVLAWLKGENGDVESSDGKSVIIATEGGKRIFGSEHPFSRKHIIFVIASTAEGVMVTATMTHARTAYDGVAKQRRVRRGWGYLANDIWASIESGELAKKCQRPIAQQREELLRTERKLKRNIAAWAIVEFAIVIGEILLGGYVQGDLLSTATGVAWLALFVIFFVLLIPLAIWIGLLANVRYGLKRIRRREELGLDY